MLPIVSTVVFEVARVAKNERAVDFVKNAMLDLIDDGSLAHRADGPVVLGRTYAMGTAIVHRNPPRFD
jgi:hypothetical protein